MAIKVLTLDGLKYYTTQFKAWVTNGFVAKVEGKDLSTNDYTDAEKTKLAGVAEGAQVNVIEKVSVNGTEQTVTEKGVNIDLSAYAVKTEMETALAGKVDVVEGSRLMTEAEASKLANLVADANATYATKADVSAIPKFAISVVDELPTADISTTTIYLVPNEGSGTNAKDEYIYVNGAWEMLGTTEVDLSGYYTSAQVDEKIAAIEGDVDAKFADYLLSADVTAITNAEIDTALA